MTKLSEILAKQRAERQAKNVPSSEQTGLSPQTPSETVQSSEKRTGKPEDKEISAVNRTSGEGILRTEPPKRLGILDRLKEKENELKSQEVNQSQTTEIAITKIPGITKTTDVSVGSTIGDRHDIKTNDGAIDVENLRKNLEFLALNIEQKDLVGNIVRTIAQQLRSTPELVPFMQNSDVDLVVRGLRRAYNVAVFVKQEKAEKKTKKSALDYELAGIMKDAGFKLGS